MPVDVAPGPPTDDGLVPQFSGDEFRRACGHFLTGVTIVTLIGDDDAPIGITANSFTSVSLAPPMVLVCVGKHVGAYRAFTPGGRYAVHLLGWEQRHLSTRFAQRGADKFAGIKWREGIGSVPILPDYLALFQCRIAHAYDAGDHTIFVGEVEGMDSRESMQPPLGFCMGSYAHLAPRSFEPGSESALWALSW